MAQQRPKGQSQSAHNPEGITRITVGGFKSISQEQSIEIRPLTILAGANSSGKSSIMQPLLLLKQTLEAPYDPGVLLLNGPNVKFTSTDQLLSHQSKKSNIKIIDAFHIGIEVGAENVLTTYFTQDKSRRKGFDVERTIHEIGMQKYRLSSKMSRDEIEAAFSSILLLIQPLLDDTIKMRYSDLIRENPDSLIVRNRCFLTLDTIPLGVIFSHPLSDNEILVGNNIRQIIHLPGLRGNPERNYPITLIGAEFPGTFEYYVASMVEQWQKDGNEKNLKRLNYDLSRLGLTNKVIARSIDDTQVELLVNRLLHSNDSAEDMVSIADVGFGVSQTLPVVVALHAANPAQLVYIEQPEIHLHPRAQLAMAEVLADAAIAGKRLVVETHSSLLLLGIQTLVAEKKLPPALVKLHWFTQQEDGSTQVTSADLDKTGAFGDWPEDFADVELNLQSRYLDAAEDRLREK